MSYARWLVPIAAALMLSIGLLAAHGSSAEPAPRLVGNPYYRVSVTNVSPTMNSAAANAPAAIPTGATLQHVVYPATTTSNWTPTNANSGNTTNDNERPQDAAPVAARALPRNRAAALGAALRVTTLADAYPANVAAIEMPQVPIRSVPVPQLATSAIEPPRFAPAPNVSQLPVGDTALDARYDAAVRPVAWTSNLVSDATVQRTATMRTAVTGEQQVGNPLRNEFADRRAVEAQPTTSNITSGNPLR